MRVPAIYLALITIVAAGCAVPVPTTPDREGIRNSAGVNFHTPSDPQIAEADSTSVAATGVGTLGSGN